jgi:CRP-like cAMP-binding protein
MYAVQSGEIDLLLGGTVIETVGVGGIFGEMSLIEQEPRVATAVARTAADLVTIDKRQFEYMTRNTPNFAFNVLRLISRRLRAMDRSALGES